MEALQTMAVNKFRHLPVLNAAGEISGVLSMNKCLYDAITKIERLQERKGGLSLATQQSLGFLEGVPDAEWRVAQRVHVAQMAAHQQRASGVHDDGREEQ